MEWSEREYQFILFTLVYKIIIFLHGESELNRGYNMLMDPFFLTISFSILCFSLLLFILINISIFIVFITKWTGYEDLKKKNFPEKKKSEYIYTKWKIFK